MKKNNHAILFWVWVSCSVCLVGGALYKNGLFGNYYIEQEMWRGRPHTWVWHNFNIVFSERCELSELTDSTFPNQKHIAEIKIQQMKAAEKLVP
jgi:hypothetical protein